MVIDLLPFKTFGIHHIKYLNVNKRYKQIDGKYFSSQMRCGLILKQFKEALKKFSPTILFSFYLVFKTLHIMFEQIWSLGFVFQ